MTAEAGATVAHRGSSPPPLPSGRLLVDPETTVDYPSPARGGLSRRVPGTHMVDAFRDDRGTTRRSRPPKVARDPEAERAALNEYLAGLARGSDDDAPPGHPSRQTAAESP